MLSFAISNCCSYFNDKLNWMDFVIVTFCIASLLKDDLDANVTVRHQAETA